MANERNSNQDPLAKLFAKLHPTEEELAELKAAERSGDVSLFVRALGELDRRYKARSIDTLGIDRKLVASDASRPAKQEIATAYPFTVQSSAEPPVFHRIGELLASKELRCDCLVPFKFRRLDVYSSMSGPEESEVARGILGAMRWGANEYTVWNPGDTTGKTRVHVYGQMHISFSASLPQAGRWCLIHPSGPLMIRGHSRVVGHGNMTTSYDAKVWVDYYQVLQVGGTLVEISGGGIHYDGTRSEDRTKYFNSDRTLPPRYVFFNAPAAGETLLLTLRIEVDTAANEDGLATGVIDEFGLPANVTEQYDTLVIKAG